MCRILSYLGKPILVDDLLYQPDNSFIKQSYHPRYMSHLLNLAGFGLIAWDKNSHQPELPFIYKTPNLPFYDDNLKNLASKMTPSCLLAHLRGVSYNDKQIVSTQNVHPFIFPNSTIALAHNGVLVDFDKIKYALLDYIHPDYQKNIRGTTDSEWIYAVFLTQLSKKTDFTPNEISQAIVATLKIIQQLRQKHKIKFASPVNLFISNGQFIAATRFVFDYGWQPIQPATSPHFTYHSLWYTYGESYGLYENEYQMKSGGKTKSSIIIASEPLTEDTTTWIALPEYTLMIAHLEKSQIQITSQDISL